MERNGVNIAGRGEKGTKTINTTGDLAFTPDKEF